MYWLWGTNVIPQCIPDSSCAHPTACSIYSLHCVLIYTTCMCWYATMITLWRLVYYCDNLVLAWSLHVHMYMLRTDYQPGRFINWLPIYKPVNRFINGRPDCRLVPPDRPACKRARTASKQTRVCEVLANGRSYEANGNQYQAPSTACKYSLELRNTQ